MILNEIYDLLLKIPISPGKRDLSFKFTHDINTICQYKDKTADNCEFTLPPDYLKQNLILPL